MPLPRRKRLLLLLTILVIGGTILTYASSWAMMLFGPTVSPGTNIPSLGTLYVPGVGWLKTARPHPDFVSGSGYTKVWFPGTGYLEDDSGPWRPNLNVESVGLPFCALSTFGEYNLGAFTAREARFIGRSHCLWFHYHGVGYCLPVIPCLPGFPLNIAFWAAFLYFIWAFSPTRFYNRIANRLRGLCPNCGYDVQNMPTCPECGATQRSSPQRGDGM